MSEIRVIMTQSFKRAYKKLHRNQKDAVNEAVQVIITNPEAGVEKKEIWRGSMSISLTASVTSIFLLMNLIQGRAF